MCAAISADIICKGPPPKSAPTGPHDPMKDTDRDDSDRQTETMTAENQKLKQENPYKLPKRKNFSKILQDEKQKSEEKYKKMLQKPVHRKAPVRRLSPVNVLRTIPSLPEPREPPPSPTSAIKNDPDFLQALAKGEKLRNMENLATFVNNKREMFLIQYMIGVKRDEILRLVQREQTEEHHLNRAEKTLEEDAVKFNDFLRHNDREAVDAVKQAEMETKQKLDKITDIKKINIHIVNLKSKISKLEDIFSEYKLYAKFLTSVAPQDWKEQKLKERQERKAKAVAELSREQADKCNEKVTIERGKRVHISVSSGSNIVIPTQPRKSPRRLREKLSVYSLKEPESEDHVSNTSTILSEMISELQLSSDVAQYLTEDDDDETVELYFTEPGQLAVIFSELEEQNLGLIQKCQETEESLEEVLAALQHTKMKMKRETKFLKEQLSLSERCLLWERQKGEEFEKMSKFYLFGEFNEEAQEQMLTELQVKIESVYTAILGPNDANLNALHMLAAIESLTEEYFSAVERMQPSKLKLALKARERQRRLLMREAKMREQREFLLQRKLRTMQKAVATRKAVIVRKVLYRSHPPFVRKRTSKVRWKTRDEEEAQYFFT